MSARERLFWIFTAVYIFLLPISNTIALRYVAFFGLIATTLWALARGELRLRFPAAAAWGLYGAVALLSLLTAVDAAYSIGQIKSEIAYSFIIFVIAASWIGDSSRLRRLAWIVATCNLFMVGYSVYLIAATPKPMSALIGSFRAATGTYSTYLVTVAPLLLFLAWDNLRARRTTLLWAIGLLIGVNILALFFTANRQGLAVYAIEVAVAGMLLLRSAFNWRRFAVFAIAVLAIAAVFGAQYQKRYQGVSVDVPESARAVNTIGGDIRWQLWNYSLREIARTPWSGAGFGREAFKNAHSEFHRTHALLWHTHNMILNKGIQMGIPGILAFLALWLAIARPVWRAAVRRADSPIVACAAALLVGVFLKNMTDDFFVQDNALMFWLICGALIATLREAPAAGAVNG